MATCSVSRYGYSMADFTDTMSVEIENVSGEFLAGLSNGGTKMTCEQMKSLDEKYGTCTRSPLHHDNRCKECK